MIDKNIEQGTDSRICSAVMTAGIAVCAAGFAAMLFMVASGNAAWFDDPVRNAFYSIRTDWLTPFVRVLTFTGGTKFTVALCIILLIIRPTRISFGLPVSAGALSVTIVNKTIKHIVARARPDDILHLVQQGGYSFPSGHSVTSMFVYGILIVQVRKHIKDRRLANLLTVILAIPLVLIGPSRIYLGVHYPTDVLAGWFLGCIGVIVCTAVMKRRRAIDKKL